MHRMLLAEDQSLVMQGLKMMIETDDELRVTGEAKNGNEAISLCEKQWFDVAILDIRMPEMDGLEAAKIIRERWPDIKVLMLTTFNDDEYALEALRIGAHGYMLKDADAESLIKSIKSCLAGGLQIQGEVAAKVVPRLLEKETHHEPKLHRDLTPRETDILKRIGEGKSNKEIADELALSVGTVKNHISVLLDKLNLRDRTQLAIFAIKNQLV
ncbi:response regulator [Tenuibacillus multivorans]|uniref:DNA-binding response regulator, NarL/FixJ family, contains REC and HTH domains n=1 Tax=Tenuibacillus multivorans TaxID=237069 RepID=A0A1H0AW54_9BACI|nr:response regulator transcription factor [Tenuibacillus multivorans]GEL77790.1 DNA-binding response regulator [Tenuibacillus multivorans]SDN37708.1 DNA-binding response regulator, NarL/FixJ family, contains REC and HTH domains [Tenuibacillus multivorans]